MAGFTAVFALLPGVADAHAVLASSQPAPEERLGTAPGVVVLEFTEPLNPKLSRATVTDPLGHRFEGSATGPRELRVSLSTNALGVYVVDWVSVSSLDGHVIRGSFPFGVGVAPTAGSGEAARTSPGAGDLAIGVLRWIEYLALMLAVGMLLLRRLARRDEELGWVRARLVAPLSVALASGVAVVASEAISAAGPGASLAGIWSYLSTGVAGLSRLSRLGLEALALLAAVEQAPSLCMLVGGATVALAASGHGAAIHPTWWGVTVDAVHLLAAGVWAGGILALAMQRPPGGWRSPAARRLLARFSPPALTAFTLTVAFGAIQAIQELGSAHALVGSAYGRVLLLKIGLVALMLPLSLVAWRLRRPKLGFEATLAVLVVAAAALLAAFPIPPGRLAQDEAERRALPSTAALPKPGELTMGGNAGQVLIGLTLHPATPGPNVADVYLLPLEGDQGAASLAATITVNGTSQSLHRCGDTCRQASVVLRGEDAITIDVAGSKGGSAAFAIPPLPAPDGSALLGHAQATMHALLSYRLSETLSSGLATIPSEYAFAVPNRMESSVNGQAQAVWIGDTRYLKLQPNKPWQVETGGPPIPVPAFIWDYFQPFVDPRIVGQDETDGDRTTIVSFAGGQSGTPIWFRLWIDESGLVRRAEMRAQGHFMDDHYYDFDAAITITPPIG